MILNKREVLILTIFIVVLTSSIAVSAQPSFTDAAKGSGFHAPLHSDIIKNPYDGGTTLSIWADTILLDTNGGARNPWAFESDAEVLSFVNNGDSVIVLDGSNDRVGIGTTVPSERLHVSGNTLTTGGAEIFGNTEIGGTARVNGSFTGGNTGYFENQITVGQGSNSASLIHGGLTVSEGSPSVNYLIVDDTGIDVTGTAILTDAIQVGASSLDSEGMIRYQNGRFWGRDASGWNLLVQTDVGDPDNPPSQYIWRENANGIHYNDGNVGIKNNLPTVELDVTGSANISSNIGVGSDLNVGSHARIANAIKIGDTSLDEIGMIRYEDTTKQFEGRDEEGWKPLVTTSVGGASQIWLQNGNIIYYDKGNVNVSNDFLVGNDLDVLGNVNVNGGGNFSGDLSADSISLFNSGSGRVLTMRSDVSQHIEATNDLFITTPDTASIHLGSGSGTGIKLRIDKGTGYVGIGTGAALATHQLDVNGNADISGDLSVQSLNSTSGLDVTGDSVFDGNVVIKGTLTVEI